MFLFKKNTRQTIVYIAERKSVPLTFEQNNGQENTNLKVLNTHNMFIYNYVYFMVNSLQTLLVFLMSMKLQSMGQNV